MATSSAPAEGGDNSNVTNNASTAAVNGANKKEPLKVIASNKTLYAVRETRSKQDIAEDATSEKGKKGDGVGEGDDEGKKDDGKESSTLQGAWKASSDTYAEHHQLQMQLAILSDLFGESIYPYVPVQSLSGVLC